MRAGAQRGRHVVAQGGVVSIPKIRPGHEPAEHHALRRLQAENPFESLEQRGKMTSSGLRKECPAIALIGHDALPPFLQLRLAHQRRAIEGELAESLRIFHRGSEPDLDSGMKTKHIGFRYTGVVQDRDCRVRKILDRRRPRRRVRHAHGWRVHGDHAQVCLCQVREQGCKIDGRRR